jgi:hypothetical protein
MCRHRQALGNVARKSKAATVSAKQHPAAGAGNHAADPLAHAKIPVRSIAAMTERIPLHFKECHHLCMCSRAGRQRAQIAGLVIASIGGCRIVRIVEYPTTIACLGHQNWLSCSIHVMDIRLFESCEMHLPPYMHLKLAIL